MYYLGEGIPKNYKLAVYWYTKSAEQGERFAQESLGHMYYYGEKVVQNYQLAYVWSSLAVANGYYYKTLMAKAMIAIRDTLEEKLSPQQIGEAQALAGKIQYKIDHPSELQKPQSPKLTAERKNNGSGTGFIITKDGYILTCHHVIKDATEIEIAIGENFYPATLVHNAPNDDLALLKIKGSFPAIAFSSKRSAKMGQEVFTIGYPNPSLQGVNAKYTEGTVNSLTGIQDDVRFYQISTPVQPGNSGGALVDENGNILGIIVAMLDAKMAFKISGSLPQNVNYAVKSTYAQAILDTMPEVSDKLIAPSQNETNAIDRVKKSTVLVLSYQ
jgi:S1-C subfamily serine protease